MKTPDYDLQTAIDGLRKRGVSSLIVPEVAQHEVAFEVWNACGMCVSTKSIPVNKGNRVAVVCKVTDDTPPLEKL